MRDNDPGTPGNVFYACSSGFQRVLVISSLNHLRLCVLHNKPFFLPVDIQRTQCLCRFFLLEIQALWSQNHDTGILHTTVVSRVDYGMTCRRSTGTAYKCKQSRFIGREINQRDKETTEKIRKKRNTIKIRGVVPPRRCSGQNRTAVRENRVRPGAKGKDRKCEAQQNHLRGSRSSLWHG